MKDLNTVTHEDFETCLNQVFVVRSDSGNDLELTLTRVKPFGAADPNAGTRQPFSLLFRGPSEPALPQRIYQLENPEFGEMSLFLVPVGPGDEGILYDATFS